MQLCDETGLEHKFARFGEALALKDKTIIEGYASRFDVADQSGDVVTPGAYAASLAAAKTDGRRIKMLWQHNPAEPIGVWDEVREDETGLWVKGRLLESTQRGREAAALIEAGALDGLSIGYRTKRAAKMDTGQRLLREVELWEVSLVTFPMLQTARVTGKAEESAEAEILCDLAAAFHGARAELARD